MTQSCMFYFSGLTPYFSAAVHLGHLYMTPQAFRKKKSMEIEDMFNQIQYKELQHQL